MVRLTLLEELPLATDDCGIEVDLELDNLRNTTEVTIIVFKKE